MFSRFSRRVTPLATRHTRQIILQPTVVTQGENTVPIFLNPPSKEDYDFSNALRLKLEGKNIDLDHLDLKIFQIKQENYEFDPPALPREQSSIWGYLWGNRLITHLRLLENLQPADEYLRGYLEKISEELRRKMRIHYTGLDWESKKAASGKTGGFSELYRHAKLEAVADFVAEDADAFLNLYRNNSYISNYDDGDNFGYNIPTHLEGKLEGLMKFDWDQHASKPDVAPYVELVSSLVDFSDSKLRNVDPNLHTTMSSIIKGEMTSNTGRLAQVSEMLETTSSSLVGEVADRKADNLKYVLSSLKAAGAVTDKDAGFLVQVMRGVGNPNEAASIKGKVDEALLTQFTDVDETRLGHLVKCVNASKGITQENVVQVVVSGLFNNLPTLFNQFATDDQNVKTWVAQNGATMESVVTAIKAQNAAVSELAKSLEVAQKAVETWLQGSLTMDKSSLASAVNDLGEIFNNSGTSSEPWYVSLASKVASESTGLERVEALTYYYLLQNKAISEHPAQKVYEAIVCSGQGKYDGTHLRECAQGFGNGTFSDNFANNLADYLSSTGKATPAQAELVRSKVNKLPEFSAMANKAVAAQEKYTATDGALSAVQWNVEKENLAALQFAYTPIPHASFENVNAY